MMVLFYLDGIGRELHVTHGANEVIQLLFGIEHRVVILPVVIDEVCAVLLCHYLAFLAFLVEGWVA